MILYYTGTGNSAYVAKRIAAALDDSCVNLFDRLKSDDTSEIHSDRPFVIVCPTYAWQIPHILRNWLLKVNLTGSSDIYFVMTCGEDIGNAAKSLNQLCLKKEMHFKGCAEIVMPENYIALFDAPEAAEACTITERANPVIDCIATCISNNEIIPDKPINFADRLKSSIVNTVFYPLIVHAKKFQVSNACIGCGKCVNACVLHNIRLENKRPVWNDNCTHCMACICGCPTAAIEYGKASEGKPRYQCPKQ